VSTKKLPSTGTRPKGDVRRYWQYGSDLILAKRGRHTTPLAVVDMRPAVFERLVEKGAIALNGCTLEGYNSVDAAAYRNASRTVIEAILGKPTPPAVSGERGKP